MPKTLDLSPKMKILSSLDELAVPEAVSNIGQNYGGVSMFSNSFKRGYGDAVFGSDENGIWLGAADFADAPFSVDMLGNMTLRNSDQSSYFNANVIIFYNDDVPEIVIGDPAYAPS
jgi:hypothetical protein